MKTIEIRRKLHDYIQGADPKKIKAIYTMVEDEIESELWTDEFIHEQKRRLSEFENKKVMGIPWEEVKTRTRKAHEAKKKK